MHHFHGSRGLCRGNTQLCAATRLQSGIPSGGAVSSWYIDTAKRTFLFSTDIPTFGLTPRRRRHGEPTVHLWRVQTSAQRGIGGKFHQDKGMASIERQAAQAANVGWIGDYAGQTTSRDGASDERELEIALPISAAGGGHGDLRWGALVKSGLNEFGFRIRRARSPLDYFSDLERGVGRGLPQGRDEQARD